MALYFNRVHNHSHTAVTVGVEDPKRQLRGGGGRVGEAGHPDPGINSFKKLKIRFLKY